MKMITLICLPAYMRTIASTPLILSLFILAACQSKRDELFTKPVSLTEKETSYLQARDAYLAELKKLQVIDTGSFERLDSVNRASLDDLDRRMKDILADARAPEPGESNLQSLLDEVGVGMLDGLSFTKDSTTRIFYTSKALFLDYFRKTDPPINDLSPESLETIFNYTFEPDAGVSNFSLVEIETRNGDPAWGMIAVVAQDIGAYTPDFLYVFLASGDYIYMAEKVLDSPAPEIQQCRELWDRVAAESAKRMEAYRQSGLEDTTAFNEGYRLEEAGWEAYCACYQKELRKSVKFASLKQELEAIAAYLAQWK